VWFASAYVLHQYAYRDTSRIVEVFTAEQGRLTLFARGVNGAKSPLRGVLRPFQRLLLSWSGRIEGLAGGEPEEASLRRFEKRLLENLGYGLELSRTADGEPISPDAYYRFAAERGAQLCIAEAPGAVYGRSLSDLDGDVFVDARSLRDAKRVLRAALEACLDGRELKSREVMRAMHRHEAGTPRSEPPRLDPPLAERP
jgi:DNA repair protein RecO (recombination protein O)